MNDHNELYRVFALTLIDFSVSEIRTFVNRKKVKPAPNSDDARNAVHAVRFLNGFRGRRGLTFRQLAEGCGYEVDAMRESIFRQFQNDDDRPQFQRLLRLAQNADERTLFANRQPGMGTTSFTPSFEDQEHCVDSLQSNRKPDGICFFCKSEIAGDEKCRALKKFCSRTCRNNFHRAVIHAKKSELF